LANVLGAAGLEKFPIKPKFTTASLYGAILLKDA